MIVAIGLIAPLLFALRRTGKDPAFIWFGAFALIFGVRLILDTGTVPFVLGLSANQAQLVRSLLTYLIAIPATLFCFTVFASWRPLLTCLLWFEAAFAAAGIITDLATGSPWSLTSVNSAIVLVVWGAFTIVIFVRPQS